MAQPKLQPQPAPAPKASLSFWKSGGGPAFSLSKTWNVARLTSEISSSPRKISCLCEGGDVFADASPIDAHAPFAIEREMPANPKAGKALLRRLSLEERFGMAQFSHLLAIARESADASSYSFLFQMKKPFFPFSSMTTICVGYSTSSTEISATKLRAFPSLSLPMT